MGLTVCYNTLSQKWKTHLPWRERQSHSASGCQAGLLWGGGRGFRQRQRAETEGGAYRWWARRGCCCSMLHSLVRWIALRWTSKSTTNNQRLPLTHVLLPVRKVLEHLDIFRMDWDINIIPPINYKNIFCFMRDENVWKGGNEKGLLYTHVNCTIFFLLTYHFKQLIT